MCSQSSRSLNGGGGPARKASRSRPPQPQQGPDRYQVALTRVDQAGCRWSRLQIKAILRSDPRLVKRLADGVKDVEGALQSAAAKLGMTLSEDSRATADRARSKSQSARVNRFTKSSSSHQDAEHAGCCTSSTTRWGGAEGRQTRDGQRQSQMREVARPTFELVDSWNVPRDE